MAKVRDIGNGAFAFYCHGCGHEHVYYTKKDNPQRPCWQFNGDLNNPSFTPSLLNRWGTHVPGYKPAGPEPVYNDGGTCHLYVTNGKINYCNDCTHGYNGKQGVEMKAYEKEE